MELRRNLELEDIIADDPYEDGRWSVLEDWLIEQDDPRAAILTSPHPERARQQLLPALFGPKHASLLAALYTLAWRGGFVRECQFAAAGIASFDSFLAAPACVLLRALQLSLFADTLRTATEKLAAAPLARSLRSLTLSMPSYTTREVVRIPGAPIGRLRLDRLSLRGVFIADPAALPPLRTLVLAATAYDVEGLAPFVCGALWPRLTELEVDMVNLGTGTVLFGELAPLFDGTIAPNLTRLTLRSASDATVDAALDTLQRTPLGRRLRGLVCGPQTTSPAMLRSRYGDAFDHLDTLALPAKWSERA